nr:hypothetical protein [Neobacillus sp. Marseille-Q6967]
MEIIQDIAEQRKLLLEKIKTAKPGKEALELLCILRERFDSAIPDYKNSLSILGDTTYEDRKHFLLELIQNADDAEYISNESFIIFYILNDSIELRYNEKGFTVDDVIAITGTGSSTKSTKKLGSKTFIGEKGIGFKSVFALAKEVEIESGPWHFKLTKDKYIVPQIIEESTIDDFQGTRLRIFFSNPESIEIVANELKRLVSNQLESFLFLQTLNSFQLIDKRNHLYSESLLSIEPPNRNKDKLIIYTSPENKQRSYKLYEEEIEFSGELVGERWERLGSSNSLMRKLTVAALMYSTDEETPTGRLFCYLPTEVKLPVPIYLQVDGHLKADRERLHSPELNSWNKFLLSKLPTFLLRAILSWREDSKLAPILPEFLPDESGTDQLSPIFSDLMSKCRNAPWVKTFDGWTSPDKAIIADSTWCRWFDMSPDFRLQVEKLLEKKFMNPEWSHQKKWSSKWETFYINRLSIFDIVSIFQKIDLPEDLLKSDENFVLVYQDLLNKLRRTRNYIDRRNIKHKLFFCNIFPLEGGIFGALKSINDSKFYWYSGRTKKAFGTEIYKNIKIIDPEYTQTLQTTSGKEEKIELVNTINERNDLVRELLRSLEVPELNEDRLLSDLQIPFILDNRNLTKEKIVLKYNILQIVFENFITKRSFDKEYLNLIAKISEAEVLSKQGNYKKFSELILPKNLRMEKEDKLYVDSGLEEIYIPDEWIYSNVEELYVDKEQNSEIIERIRKKLREFIIHCGISNGPKFIVSEYRYSNSREFSFMESGLFQSWRDRIDCEYTSQNAITIQKVKLDESTISLLNKNEATMKLEIETGLYRTWIDAYKDNLDRVDRLNYRFNPPPGYFKTIYKRFDTRTPIVKDNLWAGLKREEVPLKTIDNRLTNPIKGLRLPEIKGLDYCLKYLDIVFEHNERGYDTFYLDTLDVASMSINHVNNLWKAEGSKHYQELIKATLELARIGLNMTDLNIYDWKAKRIRPITDFKLGNPQIEGVPYIEEQYGVEGKQLGELLDLLVESEVTPLLHIIDNLYSGAFDESEKSKNIYKLLHQWKSLNVTEKGQVMEHIRESTQANGVSNNTVLVINDKTLYETIKYTNPYTILIQVDELKHFNVEKAAKEIAFKLSSELGDLVGINDKLLNDEEQRIYNLIVKEYLNDLENNEKARLFSLMGDVTYESWISQIVKVDKLTREITKECIINLDLPYLDNNKKVFYTDKNSSEAEILARLFSILGFTIYKSALRDLLEITKKVMEQESKKFKEVDKKNDLKDISPEKAKVEESPNKNKNSKDSIESIFNEIKNNLTKDGIQVPQESKGDWKTAIDPGEEESLRNSISQNLKESLEKGPEYKEKKKKAEKKSEKERNDMKVVDPEAPDPKQFLVSEYDGRCQICSTQLILHNGKKYFEVFRIKEGKGEIWWVDKPFNILSFCPNCHALARHGGDINLTGVYDLANDLKNGLIFPEEVEEFNGDYYIAEIVHNGKSKEIVVSQQHLNYIAAILQNVE